MALGTEERSGGGRSHGPGRGRLHSCAGYSGPKSARRTITDRDAYIFRAECGHHQKPLRSSRREPPLRGCHAASTAAVTARRPGDVPSVLCFIFVTIPVSPTTGRRNTRVLSCGVGAPPCSSPSCGVEAATPSPVITCACPHRDLSFRPDGLEK